MVEEIQISNGRMQLFSEQGRSMFIHQKKEAKSLSFVIIYVNDGGIICTPETIKEVIEALRKSFKVKAMGIMKSFVGCFIIDTIDKEGLWTHQPTILSNLKANFNEILNDSTRIYKTPPAPKTLFIRPKEGDLLITPET
jgi:hypothetical protein